MLDLNGFRNPDSILRPAPFWAINDKVTPKECARQMEDMRSVGLSGAFFHSRHGLVTDYLSDEWFAAMYAALEAAKRTDGYLWLYDEDLWPSGNAGGQVAGMKDEYRSALLLAYLVAAGEPVPELTEDQTVRYCYAIKSRDGLDLTSFEAVPLESVEDFGNHERLLLVRTYTPKIGWWSGESYANLLDPEAMSEFVKLTHDIYAERLGSEFGKRVPGIFTDEPQIANSPTGFAWYEGLPGVYAKWAGRNLESDLPFMFFEGPESRKIRLLVHRTINRQFIETFSKPIFEWCEGRNLEHTGHYNAEDTISGQISSHSGGVMGHYRYQQAPGIDHLCRQTDGFEGLGGMLLTVKQVSSAARQLGRTRVLDEIFGVSRHTNTFEDFKWHGDYDLVLGANFFVPHLSWYSAKGRRKRDFPPVWNYQQTYWKDLNPLNDYFTRVAYAMTRGKAAVDIVMLHPIESATAAHRLGVEVRGAVAGNAVKVPTDPPKHDMSAAEELDINMRNALEAILTTGRDCDLGDESYLTDMGSVSDENFVIGEMSYKIVIVPPSTTWRPKTFELLKQFNSSGGKIVILGKLPTELDCSDARDQWLELARSSNVWTVACGKREIPELIDKIASDSISIRDNDGRFVPKTYLQRRIDGDQEIIFVVNSDRASARDYVVTFPGARGKALAEWDAVTGSCYPGDSVALDDDLRVEISLPPCGSLLLTLGGNVDSCEQSDEECECDEDHEIAEVSVLDNEFDFERSEENALVIDRVSVSYDGGKTFEPECLECRTRRSIAEHFGTSPALAWQPWVAIRKKLFDDKGGDVVLRYKFFSDLDKPKSFAVIEDIQKGKLTVNGEPVDVSGAGWQWDRAFGKVEVSRLVKKGENVMDFAVHYDFLTEVEAAYIVGDFGVTMANPSSGKIVAEPRKLKAGTWTDQGYPFYAGRMTYMTEFALAGGGHVFLRLKNPSGTLFKIRVNGENAGQILWRPNEIDLTSLVRPGKNLLAIEVVSSLQNLWGPLHEIIGDDNAWCGPEAFENDALLREEFSIYPYGLLDGIEIVTF